MNLKNIMKLSPLKTGIISTVIGGLILALILNQIDSVSFFLESILDFIWHILTLIYEYLIDPIAVPGIFIYAGILIVIFYMIRLLKRSDAKKETSNLTNGPDFLKYNEDMFLGVKWRWKYDNMNTLDRVASFCPVCDMQLICNTTYDGIRSDLKCERCNRIHYSHNGDYDDIESRVEMEIERNLRTGDWKKRIFKENVG